MGPTAEEWEEQMEGATDPELDAAEVEAATEAVWVVPDGFEAAPDAEGTELPPEADEADVIEQREPASADDEDERPREDQTV